MKISAQLIRKFRWQNRLFYLLFSLVIILAAMLSEKYQVVSDWTQNRQNSLNEKTLALLQLLQEPIRITSYTADKRIKKVVKRLISRYQQVYPHIQLTFIDPALNPQKTRQLGIRVEGELIIEIGERSEHLTELDESQLSNSILRLARQAKRRIYFVAGHGERRFNGQANFDLAHFSQQLQKQGFELSSIKLSEVSGIDPSNDVLVIAGPQVDYLAGEVEILLNMIERGTNLLWLLDPLKDSHSNQYLLGLEPLAERLGIELSEGVVVDTTTRTLQLERPDYAIIGDYVDHPITQSMQNLTLFPQAVALDPMLPEREVSESERKSSKQFSFDAFLLTIEQSWTETSEVKGTIHYDADEDTLGPLIIGVTQTRLIGGEEEEENGVQITPELDQENATSPADMLSNARKQRVVIVGDGDFLSNAFVGNGGNLELGLNIFNWLSRDEQLISIPVREKLDGQLNLSERQLMVIGFGFFLVLPLLFISTGLWIRLKRRKRESA